MKYLSSEETVIRQKNLVFAANQNWGICFKVYTELKSRAQLMTVLFK